VMQSESSLFSEACAASFAVNVTGVFVNGQRDSVRFRRGHRCGTCLTCSPTRVRARDTLGQSWTVERQAMQEVADWLERLGVGQYAKSFAENGIDDISILHHLTRECPG
jgi:hypothetical protein